MALIPETDRMVVVKHQEGERFEAQARSIEHTPRLVLATGEIATNLYEGVRDQDIPMVILLQTYQSLNHIVDFQREMCEGNTFAFGYESFDDGEKGGIHPVRFSLCVPRDRRANPQLLLVHDRRRVYWVIRQKTGAASKPT